MLLIEVNSSSGAIITHYIGPPNKFAAGDPLNLVVELPELTDVSTLYDHYYDLEEGTLVEKALFGVSTYHAVPLGTYVTLGTLPEGTRILHPEGEVVLTEETEVEFRTFHLEKTRIQLTHDYYCREVIVIETTT